MEMPGRDNTSLSLHMAGPNRKLKAVLHADELFVETPGDRLWPQQWATSLSHQARMGQHHGYVTRFSGKCDQTCWLAKAL